MSEERKETYLKLPNVTVGELQDVVDFMEDNDIEYVEFYEKDLKQQIEDLQQKDKEIVRLNNIIDELEKVIQENKFWIYNDVLETRENFEVIDVEYILDKLKALKENNK